MACGVGVGAMVVGVIVWGGTPPAFITDDFTVWH